MTRNEKRFGVIGTIGNGEPLIAAKRRESFHVIERTAQERKETAIRMDYDSALDLATEIANTGRSLVFVARKPILTEAA